MRPAARLASLTSCVALALGLAARGAEAQAPAAGDVRFMQQMIGHHAQALVLSALVPARSQRRDVRTVAERIAASQGDEIALMRDWLVRRGAAAPDSAAVAHTAAGHATGGAGDDRDHTHGSASDASHAAHAGHAMPGMLTSAELARLRVLRGPAFDRAFLAAMIRHHEGALAMVAELFATPGAAQDSEAFRLASDVDADQRAEIRRMRAMLRAASR